MSSKNLIFYLVHYSPFFIKNQSFTEYFLFFSRATPWFFLFSSIDKASHLYYNVK